MGRKWQAALVLVFVAVPGTALALAQTVAVAAPSVKPGAVIAKVGTPPPASATNAKSVGKTVKANTANAATDDDSFWIEKTDIDGDGNVDDSSLVWDDEDGVLFAWTDGTFTCANGGTGAGEILIATFGPKNVLNKPAGSGFWIAAVDQGECAAQAAGLVGCKFDAKGNPTACGAARLDEANNDFVIVAVKGS